MRCNFNTNFEYDEWFDKMREKQVLDDYYGNEIKMEVEKREDEGKRTINKF